MASLSQPVGVHNLTAWFIFAPPAAARHPRDYAVLEETIAAETAVLHETGSVNELLIENKGDLDLFIQAGDIVKGGRQDRTIGADFIVPARSGKIPLPAFCVEEARWRRRRDEADTHFSTAKDFLASKKARLAMRLSKSQAEVGGSVVGVVWAINGVPSHADQYVSPKLFAKLWRKLLRAAATEAIGQRRGPASNAAAEPPSSEAIGAWLESYVPAGATHAEDERLLPRTRIRTHRGTSLHRFEAFDTALDEASPLHMAVVAE